MEMEILEKKQNNLMNRIEIRFKISHPKETTPNRDSAREKMAALVNVKKEQVIIDSLDTKFGVNETTGYAKVYPTKEEAMKIERDYQLIRNKLKEKKEKKADGAKPAKAEAKPAEKPKTEAKPEAKPAEKPAEKPKGGA